MTPEEFRTHAHRLVDWMADYMSEVERFPVRAQTRPGDTASALPPAAPEAGEPMETVFADFERIVMPGMTHWQHPRFFAYFPANSSPPSVLAEMLTAALGAQCMLWQTSPAATEMETRMLDWLRQAIGLPEGFSGVIQDSASSAILCALLTARERATGGEANERGLAEAGAVPVAYTSDQAHSATEKGAKIAGYGRNRVRLIETGRDFTMKADALDAAIRRDKAAGLRPACIVASLGTTGVGAIDRLDEIGAVARAHDVFFHVDAAWAGSALICEEHRWMLRGVETVDSLVFNPHKWLLTNFDCSAHFVRDPDALVRTLSILPPFLQSREGDAVIDYRDWSVPLGRRFRALKLWFVLRSYGLAGLRELIRQHIALAEWLEGEIATHPDFELMAPRSLALLNFRYAPAGASALDELNERLLHTINDEGRIYLTQNSVRGAYAIRVSIGQTGTGRIHVEQAWEAIRAAAARLQSRPGVREQI